MEIDIFNLKPNVVSSDLSGKSFLIYGEKKSGKTTQACKFPKPILLAFEKGYGLISGIIAQPINKWTEAISVKNQLVREAEAVRDGKKNETTFSTVIVDTCDLAYDYCESYVLDLEGVTHLDETTNMRGYREISLEYDNFFQEIVKAGYTLVIISHAKSKQVKENGEKYDKTIPTVQDRGFLVVSRLVDVCGYASYETDEEGHTQSMLTIRGNKYLEAGSRNKYMSDRIPFTYEALLADMTNAIKRMQEEGENVSATPAQLYADVTPKANFKDTVEAIKILAKKMNDAGEGEAYKEIVTTYLGRNRLVRDCDESQTEILALILSELKAYIKDHNVSIEV